MKYNLAYSKRHIYFMHGKIKLIRVIKNHKIQVPRNQADGWISAGAAYLAPLQYKRDLLIDEYDHVRAWTIFNDQMSTDDWEIRPSVEQNLVFNITLSTHTSGWVFVIPKEIRNAGWLPKCGGQVIREIIEEDKEVNIWHMEAHAIQEIRTL